MITAELSISLAEMIRRIKVQIISCTGANLEKELMNHLGYSHYRRERDPTNSISESCSIP
ncbi:MAG: hypothetical protein Q7V19_17350 [Bacteroidales bacterium]|nr:hypothetical protein [Bacteroidales bacterium]MDP2238237.1 hypothetical protein [Bacteroidales bacterium]